VLFYAEYAGSSSIKLFWSVIQSSAPFFDIYCGTDSTFAHAAKVGTNVDLFAGLFNCYSLSPGSQYFFWVSDPQGNVSGPVECTTMAMVVDTPAMDEAQMDALQEWAFNTFDGAYPVIWKYQVAVQPTKPKIVLNVLSVIADGSSDDLRDMNERLAGSRRAMISVNVSTDPQPQMRAMCSPNSALPAGDYSVIVSDGLTPVTYKVAYAAPPASMTVVSSDLADVLKAVGFTAWLSGLDDDAQMLMIEHSDPRAIFSVTGGDNFTTQTFRPIKAMTMAQRLQASLSSPFVREALSLAFVSPGTTGDIKDLSEILETKAELRAQFDFPVFLASNLAVAGPIIDTVASVDGTTN
jgi:hypothetical protein